MLTAAESDNKFVRLLYAIYFTKLFACYNGLFTFNLELFCYVVRLPIRVSFNERINWSKLLSNGTTTNTQLYLNCTCKMQPVNVAVTNRFMWHFVILTQEIFTLTKRNLFDEYKLTLDDKKKKISSIRLRLMLLKRTCENISWAEKEIQKFERVHCLRNGL